MSRSYLLGEKMQQLHFFTMQKLSSYPHSRAFISFAGNSNCHHNWPTIAQSEMAFKSASVLALVICCHAAAVFAQCKNKGGETCAPKSQLSSYWQGGDFTSEGDNAPCFNMDQPVCCYFITKSVCLLKKIKTSCLVGMGHQQGYLLLCWSKHKYGFRVWLHHCWLRLWGYLWWEL